MVPSAVVGLFSVPLGLIAARRAAERRRRAGSRARRIAFVAIGAIAGIAWIVRRRLVPSTRPATVDEQANLASWPTPHQPGGFDPDIADVTVAEPLAAPAGV